MSEREAHTNFFCCLGAKKCEFKRPRKSISRRKYNNKGIFGKSCFAGAKLPEIIEATLLDTVNYSLSRSTKSVYNTAANMLQQCREDLNEKMPLPLTERDILIFVGHNIRKGNQVGTVKSYLAGLKKYHCSLGHFDFNYLTPLVKEVLEGYEKKKVEGVGKVKTRKYGKKFRLPCTPTILKLIKLELKNSNFSSSEKIFAWAMLLYLSMELSAQESS